MLDSIPVAKHDFEDRGETHDKERCCLLNLDIDFFIECRET
jgi:hypothetical protein